MHQRCFKTARMLFVLSTGLIALAACGGGGSSAPATTLPALVPSGKNLSTSTLSQTTGITNRHSFVGAFFRAEGPPPYGIFSAKGMQIAPVPYPTLPPAGASVTGSSGYCDRVAANGASIDGSYPVDATKLSNVINLGARWTRMPVSQYFVDESHVFGSGVYAFGTMDAAQCVSYAYHNIKPVIGLEAGPVEYNAIPGKFSPQQVPTYKSPSDFGQWCGVVAAHERAVFPGVTQYSLPGNEVNSNPQLFPGGEPQIAAYSKACYAAVKAANPTAFVYGFELNTQAGLNPAGFVSRLAALGCGVGTCYDGIAMHLTLVYPIPSSTTPCFPHPGGAYSMQCISDIQTAAGSAVHVLISESVYTVPGNAPDEATKAQATVAAFTAFAANPTVDGVSYANVDECALYPSGYFSGGCLIDTSGKALPAWYSLQWLAAQHFL